MVKILEAIILAGGYGTRLKSVVPDLPKPMATIQTKPFLSYLLDVLISSKFSKAVLAVGYKASVISNYFGNSYRGMQIEYSVENEPLGTGGAIRQAMDLCNGDYIFVLNGDTFFQLVREGYKQINVIESKAGVIRGGHYHKINREAFYIVNGSLKFVARLGDEREEYIFHKGDMFAIAPNVAHDFNFLEDTVLVSMYDKGVEIDANSKDIHVG